MRKKEFEQISMIEDAQETQVITPEQSPLPASRSAFERLRGRRLSAIEIAEGALLADVGVVFHLLIRILPVGGNALSLMVPVIFAILVLRRGLYVACMSLCVALFLIGILLGTGGMPFLLLEAGAGIFLGLTMRHRLRHFMTIAIGVVCGGLSLAAVILLYSYLAGGPGALVRGLRLSYEHLFPLLGAFFRLVRLGGFWQTTLLPLFNRFMEWGLQNWLILLYLLCCLTCVPVVIIVYFVTNFFLRLLGYQVRPFPGYFLEGLLYRFLLWPFKVIPRRIIARGRLLHVLKREVRRLNIARLRQRRLEKEVGEQL
jgi:Predicted membrane protein (DUF2232)